MQPKEIPCPSCQQSPELQKECDLCGGAGILIVKPKTKECVVCQGKGNIVATPQGYAKGQCRECGAEPDDETMAQALRALAEQNANDDRPVAVSSSPINKNTMTDLLKPSVTPDYMK